MPRIIHNCASQARLATAWPLPIWSPTALAPFHSTWARVGLTLLLLLLCLSLWLRLRHSRSRPLPRNTLMIPLALLIAMACTAIRPGPSIPSTLAPDWHTTISGDRWQRRWGRGQWRRTCWLRRRTCRQWRWSCWCWRRACWQWRWSCWRRRRNRRMLIRWQDGNVSAIPELLSKGAAAHNSIVATRAPLRCRPASCPKLLKERIIPLIIQA